MDQGTIVTGTLTRVTSRYTYGYLTYNSDYVLLPLNLQVGFVELGSWVRTDSEVIGFGVGLMVAVLRGIRLRVRV